MISKIMLRYNIQTYGSVSKDSVTFNVQTEFISLSVTDNLELTKGLQWVLISVEWGLVGTHKI